MRARSDHCVAGASASKKVTCLCRGRLTHMPAVAGRDQALGGAAVVAVVPVATQQSMHATIDEPGELQVPFHFEPWRVQLVHGRDVLGKQCSSRGTRRRPCLPSLLDGVAGRGSPLESCRINMISGQSCETSLGYVYAVCDERNTFIHGRWGWAGELLLASLPSSMFEYRAEISETRIVSPAASRCSSPALGTTVWHSPSVPAGMSPGSSEAAIAESEQLTAPTAEPDGCCCDVRW